jgi:mono/diheme cytochrome c family protein
MKRNILFALMIMLFAGTFLALTVDVQPEPWPVPANYESMENPVSPDDKEAVSVGKSLYNQHCKSCHGKEGLGDGPKAAQLDTPSGDFTDPAFHEQSDGALFYKSLIGRDEMPNFEKKIPDAEDMWSIVNYMRTFE